jgi:hypothetical protein
MCVHMSSSRPKTDFSVSAENEYSRQENAAEYSADNKVHRSYKEGIAKLPVVFRSAGRHLRNGTKQ